MNIRYLFVLLFLFFFTIDAFTLEGELIIKNKSYQKNIRVEVYPIGAIFNGDQKYSIDCINPNFPEYTKIIGGSKILPKVVGTTFYSFNLDHDASEDSRAEAAIGYGKYRVVFIEFYNDTNFSDGISTYCDVDFSDADYPYDGLANFTADLTFNFYSITNIEYHFIGDPISIPQNKLIVSWDQRNQNNPNSIKLQNKNGFISDINYSDWPINAINYGAENHILPDECFLNVEIRDQNINIPTNENLIFKFANLTIKDSINFSLNSNSNLIFQNGAKFRTFETGSPKTITMGENAIIDVKSGASVNLNNTVFQSTNSSVKWKGIKLTDTYLDTISNCAFKNTDTCINLYNSDKCLARTKKIITGSKFENGVVKLSNVFNALISNDSFYSSNNNQYLLTVSNSVHPSDFSMLECAEEFDYGTAFNLNIAGNYFSGGRSADVS